MTTQPVTEADIQNLLSEAALAGDIMQAAVCRVALCEADEDDEYLVWLCPDDAWWDCVSVIERARAGLEPLHAQEGGAA